MQHGIHSTFDTHSALCMDHYRCHLGSFQCHSLSSLPATKLSCSLQLRLLDVSLSLTLPLDEPVVIDAKEDKELAPSDVSARLLFHSPGAGSVLLYFVHHTRILAWLAHIL